MNILIINSVPLNTGDEALLEATCKALTTVFENTKITVLCKRHQLCRELIPAYQFYPDFEYAQYDFGTSIYAKFKSIFKRKLIALGFNNIFTKYNLLQTKQQKQVLYLYAKSDLIISSPGGYLHDYYGYLDRLKTFELLSSQSKPIVLLAQSIGPFWKKEYLQRLRESFNKMLAISVRESFSLDHLKKLNLSNEHILLTTDNAFLLYDKNRKVNNQNSSKSLNIALSFRKWQNKLETDIIIKKARQFCCHLLNKHPHLMFTFLSTCQGVKGYVEDSKIAEIIINKLPEEYKSRCSINAKRNNPNALINSYAQFDAYIGMRLHGAILSMIGNTPAFNIGYELKSEGIYSALDLLNYQIHYKTPVIEWIEKTELFLNALPQIKKRLPSIMEQQRNIAFQHILEIKNIYLNRNGIET